MQNNERLVMSIDDLVKLGFGSRNTLYRLARLDQLPVPTITVGRKLYFSRLAVQKLLERTDNGAESEAGGDEQ